MGLNNLIWSNFAWVSHDGLQPAGAQARIIILSIHHVPEHYPEKTKDVGHCEGDRDIQGVQEGWENQMQHIAHKCSQHSKMWCSKKAVGTFFLQVENIIESARQLTWQFVGAVWPCSCKKHAVWLWNHVMASSQ